MNFAAGSSELSRSTMVAMVISCGQRININTIKIHSGLAKYFPPYPWQMTTMEGLTLKHPKFSFMWQFKMQPPFDLKGIMSNQE